MADLDPFTQVYNALWEMLETRSVINKMVRLGNRIRLDGKNRDPIKNSVGVRDLPEILIVPGNSAPHIQRTSNSSTCLETIEIRVSTGDQRIHELLYPLKWEIYRALATWATKLQSLMWKNKTFVRLAKPVSASDVVTDSDLNRGVIGWSTIWACEVEMWFSTADLQGD